MAPKVSVGDPIVTFIAGLTTGVFAAPPTGLFLADPHAAIPEDSAKTTATAAAARPRLTARHADTSMSPSSCREALSQKPGVTEGTRLFTLGQDG